MDVSGGNYTTIPSHIPHITCIHPLQTRTGSAMQGSSEGGMPTCGVLGPYAAAWAVLVEPAASLMAPLLGMEDLFVLSLVSKGLRPIWGQLCHLGPLNNKWIIELLASGAYQAEGG